MRLSAPRGIEIADRFVYYHKTMADYNSARFSAPVVGLSLRHYLLKTTRVPFKRHDMHLQG